MKVLMFGWEFPPHILGGLGTASYGLTKGLSLQPDMDITFCIPKPWGDEEPQGALSQAAGWNMWVHGPGGEEPQIYKGEDAMDRPGVRNPQHTQIA